jgi:hypothetical protein
MNSIAKILNAIQICRNAYVQNIPAPDEQLPDPEQAKDIHDGSHKNRLKIFV